MCPAEASVGVNAKAVVRGIQREDKNIMGTLHFGLGTNVDVGGSIKSKIHMDGVILHPTLYVDGVKRIDNGKILVEIEKEELGAHPSPERGGEPAAPSPRCSPRWGEQRGEGRPRQRETEKVRETSW